MRVPDVVLLAAGSSRRLWPLHAVMAACGMAMAAYGLAARSWPGAVLGICFGTVFAVAVVADLSLPKEPASTALRLGLPAVLVALVVVGVLLPGHSRLS